MNKQLAPLPITAMLPSTDAFFVGRGPRFTQWLGKLPVGADYFIPTSP